MTSSATGSGTTYVLVDGENIDMVLGGILNQKPEPRHRPRWQQLLTFAEEQWGQPAKGLFFINATHRGLHAPFEQALLAMGYRPIPLAGHAGDKVVDLGIQRTLEAIAARSGDVLLASHDGDFVDDMTALATGARRLGVVAFTDMVSQSLREIPGVELFDLETDVGAFDLDLPRVRIIPLDEFDPVAFL